MNQEHSSPADPASVRHLQLIRAAARRVEDESRADADAIEDPSAQLIAQLQPYLPGYHFIRELPAGGQGRVLHGIQLSTGRLVAVKVPANGARATPSERERFLREVRLTARLDHPNIVRVYDGPCNAPILFYMMQFVDGVPIDAWIDFRKPALDEIVRLFIQMADAVSFAHQRAVIHRDLKPANVLVDDEGTAYILDFGLGRALDDSAERRVSAADHILGTLDYMSPEQASGASAAADVRTDIYCLGLIMFRILTGRPPYPSGLSIAELCTHIMQRDLPSPRAAMGDADGGGQGPFRPAAIPDDLDLIVHKATARHPDDRYQSAAALADDLRRFAAGEAISARADQIWYQIRKTLRRYPKTSVAAVLAFAIIVGLGGFSTAQWLEARAQRRNAIDAAGLASSTLSTVVGQIDTHIQPLVGGTTARREILGVVEDKLAQLAPLMERDEELAPISRRLMQNRGQIAYLRGRPEESRELLLKSLLMLRASPAYGRSDVDAMLDEVRLEVALAGMTDEDDAIHQEAIAHATAVMQRAPSAAAVCAYREAVTARLRYLFHRARFADAYDLIALVPAAWEPVPADTFTDWQHATAAADYLELKGEILVRCGRAAGAATELDTAMAIRALTCASQPASALARHRKLVTACRLAAILRDEGDLDRSIELLQGAIADGRFLVHADASSAIWTRDLVQALLRLCRTRVEMNEHEAAFRAADEAHSILAAFAAPVEESRSWRMLSADCLDARGKSLLKLQRYNAAIDDLLASNQISALLLGEHLDDGLYLERSQMHVLLGMAYTRIKDWDSAYFHYQAAYEARTQILNRNPDSASIKLHLVGACNNLASWHLRQRKAAHDEAAAGYLLEAEQILDELEAAGPLASHANTIGRRRCEVVTNQCLYLDRVEARAAGAAAPLAEARSAR